MLSRDETTLPQEKILLSRREAAAALSICIRLLDYLIAQKLLPIVRIGRRVLIHRQSLNSFATRSRHADGPKRSSDLGQQ